MKEKEILPARNLRYWFFRGWLLYALLAGAGLVLVDINKMVKHAGPSTLSRLRPSYSYISQFADGVVAFNRKSLEDYRLYLENVNRIMGERPDVDALLGYVTFYLGDKKKAEEYWVKSSKLNPSFFWNYYCLGVLSFSRGEHEQAKVFLQKAVVAKPELSMGFLLTSRIFIPLLHEGGYTPQKLLERLYSGYADAYKILVLIAFSGQNYDRALSYSQDGFKMSAFEKDQVFFLYYVGVSAYKQGNLPLASKAWEECLRLDKDHPEALIGMASILNMTGKKDVARVLMDRSNILQKKQSGGLSRSEDFKVKVF